MTGDVVFLGVGPGTETVAGEDRLTRRIDPFLDGSGVSVPVGESLSPVLAGNKGCGPRVSNESDATFETKLIPRILS